MIRNMLITCALAVAGSAAAQELKNELTPIGGYRFGGSFDVDDSDESYEWQDTSSFGLIWNRAYRDNTEWEVFLSQQETEAEFSGTTAVDPVVDVETTVFQLGGTYLFEGDKARPYVAATIGGTYMRAESGGSKSDTFLSMSIGVGIKVAPTSRFGLRLEARVNNVLTSKDTELFCQTGPDLNVCAIEVAGDLFTQVETFAGVVFRF